MSMIRTRWAAVGAAVAITLGASGIGLVGATSPAGASAFVPIDPCRLADIRPNTIGAGGSMTFDGWGTTGACTLPAGTTGLALNVTAVGATQQTNLRFHPTGTPVPGTANLNPTPGAPATPNAVNVTLNATNGRFDVYNRFGNVAVIIDVMGYYTDHHHDDRYHAKSQVYTKSQVRKLVFDGTIPSGVTVTGNFVFDSALIADGADHYVHVPLPAKAPVGLTADRINFASDSNSGTIDDDPTCNGSLGSPTAPPGKVCIYLKQLGGLHLASGESTSLYTLLTDAGFMITWRAKGTAGIDMFLHATWAYTAP